MLSWAWKGIFNLMVLVCVLWVNVSDMYLVLCEANAVEASGMSMCNNNNSLSSSWQLHWEI